ncbi:GNAT family N-acetyltransferase [Halanaeroarchaeum sulfurireducens]|uniref:Acetyltransferase n=1 Tax=Halanaeroarchaeum sulfurireducens TaxID=1604004 RepID=A0A0F7PDD9_9EURY|nr:GNAT family N-acetyltransferase [Halanaeroarchaeum sulfurireducens]AKH98195.1 acetyltransferase [Halanaeroarchaeum sulfurireducens]ALG82589.1 acetyltransferase [Halanaeroarchaeum sulfurireducens]
MVRAYEPSDAEDLWTLKRAFERGLGAGTGNEEKEAVYEAKLDESYREEYLDWVGRCITEDRRSVQVGERDDELVGYVFVLPESLAYIWDAAVLNEVYVDPAYRGTDLGDALMEGALAYARDMDLPLDRMVLDVDRENDRAQAFYERWGFEHWGEMVGRDL